MESCLVFGKPLGISVGMAMVQKVDAGHVK